MNMKEIDAYKKGLTELKQDKLVNLFSRSDLENQELIIKKYPLELIKTLNKMYIDLVVNSKLCDEVILSQKHTMTPCKIYWKNDFQKENKYFKIGENAIRDGKVGVVFLAAGLGTRLGFNAPKGTFELDLNGKKTSLFDCLIGQITEASKKYNTELPIYIMCSENNYEETKKYFEKTKYFNYPKHLFNFLVQGEMPIYDKYGKIMLQDNNHLCAGPTGNGDVFRALKSYGYIDKIKAEKIEWLIFSGIDNILIDLVDPLIIGLSIANNTMVASKSLSKPDDKTRGYVFARQDGKFYLIENGKITNELANKKNKRDKYLFRETNIAYHLVNTCKLDEYANKKLPFHTAHRKISYLDDSGNIVTPEEANSYKFEHYIYEAFYDEDDMLVLSIDNNEFSPLKNITGDKSVETVQKDYEKKFH